MDCTVVPKTKVIPADYIGDYWLVRVDRVEDITNPDYDHAYQTPDNSVYVLSHDGSGLVQIGTGGGPTYISNTDNLLRITGSGTYTVTVNIDEDNMTDYIFSEVRRLVPCSGGNFDALVDRSIVEAKSDAVTRIGSNAFAQTPLLTTVDFPLVTSIGASAFQGAISLTTVDFPLVTSIGASAFQGAISLTKFVIRTPALAPAGIGVFADTPIASGTGYIYVPDNLVAQYKIFPNWSTYASQIRPISDL